MQVQRRWDQNHCISSVQQIYQQLLIKSNPVNIAQNVTRKFPNLQEKVCFFSLWCQSAKTPWNSREDSMGYASKKRWLSIWIPDWKVASLYMIPSIPGKWSTGEEHENCLCFGGNYHQPPQVAFKYDSVKIKHRPPVSSQASLQSLITSPTILSGQFISGKYHNNLSKTI